ncbi:MAG: putative mycofactocin radical SAM maturase MftC [Candidatus Anoxychlamydiales bacterium]|nr:putative mycofactocin radical SAM maturase MftC [Candidatus Anoxychlamydiales bacterium]
MKTKNIKTYFLGKITYEKKPYFQRKNYVYITDEAKNIHGYAGVILKQNNYIPKLLNKTPVLFDVTENNIKEFQKDDIILVDANGKYRIVWDLGSEQNSLLFTEACNCCCQMCPQPLQKHDPSYLAIAKKTLSLLDPNKTKTICLTGGEPTLFENDFLEILQICKKKFSQANITLLTNGKKFSNFDFTKKMTQIGLKKFLICISLHADTDSLHDNIVGVRGSFSQTIRGLYNLAKFKHQIEIRFVISNLNYKRMESFSYFLFRNFPFLSHIAFMGMEVTGYALNNYEKLWIDPFLYRTELKKAVHDLNRKAMNVSIYNIPHCLLERDSWEFSRQSISSWKNAFLENCSNCSYKNDCCGIFTTSNKYQSSYISPISSPLN